MNWITDALLAALFGGLVAVFGKIGVQGVDSVTATMVRSLIMAAALVLVASLSGKTTLSGISGRTLLFVFLSGLSGAAALSMVLLGERPGVVPLFGAGLVVAGTLVLAPAP